MTQVNQGDVAPNVEMIRTKVWHYMSMSSSEFHHLKMDEDPQEFVDKVYKILAIMGYLYKRKRN